MNPESELFILKLVATCVLMLGSAVMIAARRLKNKDRDAGCGIAGWTIFIVLMMWMD